jgi:hypothetical protein
MRVRREGILRRTRICFGIEAEELKSRFKMQPFQDDSRRRGDMNNYGVLRALLMAWAFT